MRFSLRMFSVNVNKSAGNLMEDFIFCAVLSPHSSVYNCETSYKYQNVFYRLSIGKNIYHFLSGDMGGRGLRENNENWCQKEEGGPENIISAVTSFWNDP